MINPSGFHESAINPRKPVCSKGFLGFSKGVPTLQSSFQGPPAAESETFDTSAAVIYKGGSVNGGGVMARPGAPVGKRSIKKFI